MRDDEAFRHSCEVRDCIKRYYPNAGAMAAHLERVKSRRGEDAYQRLRADALIAWQARKAAA